MNKNTFFLLFSTTLIFLFSTTLMTYLYIDLSKSKIKEIHSLRYLSDSLHADLYPCEIELNRYKIAFEILSIRNPKAAQEYGNIISEETE